MKMKKEYISPSIQVLHIESENILSGSTTDNEVPGMPFPSEPGKGDNYYYYDDEF